MTTENTILLDMFPWAPRPMIVLALLTASVAGAVAVHSLLWALFKRFFGERYPFLHGIILRTRTISRFAFIIVAFSMAVSVAPFRPRVADSANRALLAAFIVFLGWLVIVGANLVIDRYAGRFRLDVTDNLLARKAVTQMRLLKRALDTVLVVITLAFALMSFDSVREFGVSLFASAGVAGIAAGLAARPLLENLLAGVQLAITQPIRLDDVLIVEGEYGTVEEITSTYVVLKLWDWRRMIVPLTYFIEKPFQNWTRETSALIGSAFIYVDYHAPVEAVREKLNEIVKQSKLWDGRVVNLQVTDAKEGTIELRCLMSANSASHAFDLRCEVREKLVDFLQKQYPAALPRQRAEVAMAEAPIGATKVARKLKTR
jgi:small-conductance mechanosensitive channel